PSALGESTYLQNKYSKPIYGSANGIKSHNFKNHVWISNENSDPYATLALENSPSIRDGGSASMAYTRMQFTHMDDEEHAALNKALLKYCELDTFAMVMIMEYWLETSRANE